MYLFTPVLLIMNILLMNINPQEEFSIVMIFLFNTASKYILGHEI